MRGTRPYFGIALAGSHLSPVRIGIKPMSRKAGKASHRRKNRIKNIPMIEDMAQINQNMCITCSNGLCLQFCLKILSFPDVTIVRLLIQDISGFKSIREYDVFRSIIRKSYGRG